MSDQIVLAWTVNASESPLSPIQAAARLAAVPLHSGNPDSVLGQAGLTVAGDSTVYAGGPAPPAWAVTPAAGQAARSILLNMTFTPGTPFAPPPFPAHPTTLTPPALPYRLERTVPLAGSFLVTIGSSSVPTGATQLPALVNGDRIQFATDPGVTYRIAGITSTALMLTSAYAGPFSASTTAAKVLAAPVTLAALYSTSPLDTSAVGTTPPIPSGSGAVVVTVSYLDSLGAAGSVAVFLKGKRPATVTLAGGTIDIAVVTNVVISTVGNFGNSVGQITLCELSSALPPIPPNATQRDFQRLTDEAQLLITRALVYLPPSYFSLAAQRQAAPPLVGDFFVTTNSASVPTAFDQTSALSAGDVVQFAAQLENDTPFGRDPVFYTVATVSPTIVTLTEPFMGMGPDNVNPALGRGVKGSKSTQITNFATAATRVNPSSAVQPLATQLKTPLGGYVNPALAVGGVEAPTPTYLSDLYTRTISLALAMPVTAAPITLI